ncbi:MAG: hypothetical protein AB1642_09720 [Pseudomonadota bacterium]
MPQRRVLFLDTSRLSAWRLAGKSVEAEESFSADPTGFEAFGAYLKHHHRSLFALLADVPEEGFQIEEIPHSSGKDRAAIIKRKLAQYFYGTPLSLAQSQGRLKTGRRDERLLMMALTRPQHFEPWLEVLRTAQANLAGIYSLPQLVHHLLPAAVAPQVVQITLTRGGLRQTYFADRQLRFSRLTPLATGSTEESAIAAALEANKMHQYLASQRLIERGKPLATRVLVHPAQISAMRERCRDSGELRFEFVDLLQEAKRLGLGAPGEDSQAEALFGQLLLKRAPAEQFAPPAERQFFRLWQTRFALKGAGAVILAGGLLFAAKQGLEIQQLQDETGAIRQQTRLDQQRYDDTLRALPKIPLSTDNLRTLVDRYEQVLKRAPGPAPLLVQLSQSLDAFPRITIDRLEWEIGEQIAPVQAGAAAAGAPAAPPPPNMAGGPYAHATVVGRLPIGMAGDQRGQLTLVADFVKHLEQAPNTLVTLLQPPVDTQSGKTLKSGDDTSTPEAPRFTFRLTRKL